MCVLCLYVICVMRVFCPFVRLKLHIYNLTQVLARDLTRKLFLGSFRPLAFPLIYTSIFLFILLSQFKHTNQQWNIVFLFIFFCYCNTMKKEVRINIVLSLSCLGVGIKSPHPPPPPTPGGIGLRYVYVTVFCKPVFIKELIQKICTHDN